MFRGSLRVPNFFVTSLRARNIIPSIKLLAMSKTAKIEFFSYFRSKLGQFVVVPRCFGGSHFFCNQSVCQKLYSGNNIIVRFQKRRNQFFFCIFGVNKCSLGVFRGALGVSNFFVTSLCAKNCIPAIKLLCDLKNGDIRIFLSYFRNK